MNGLRVVLKLGEALIGDNFRFFPKKQLYFGIFQIEIR